MKKAKIFVFPADIEHITNKEILSMRFQMGCESLDLSNDVKVEARIVETCAGDVPVCIYTPGGIMENRPVCIYIHGGAFFGGTMRVVENACKLTAERSTAVVISVGYALAPENPFPRGLEQCNQIVLWARQNAESLGCDPEKLVIMGDSAGGNLATACCMLDMEHRIKLQVLLYPVTQLINENEHWNFQLYNICEHIRFLEDMVYDTGHAKALCRSTYVSNSKDLENPLVSPLQAQSLKGMPATLIITAEFDYLRLEAEEYARRLQEDNVSTVIIRYNGINHAFFEHIGEFPQAEDCATEIAAAIRAL